MSIISRWKERRRQKKQLRELSGIASVFKTLEQLEQSGLLAWSAKQRQLFIDDSLALLMMKDADTWQNFVQNTYLWLYYRESQAAWEAYLQKEELAAVRKFMKESHAGEPHGTLSRSDIDRIRRARREEIAQGDMQPPKVEGFEFIIVAPPNLNGQSSMVNGQSKDQPVGIPVAVGHYSPDTERMEMATWQEVEMLLAKAKNNQNVNHS